MIVTNEEIHLTSYVPIEPLLGVQLKDRKCSNFQNCTILYNEQMYLQCFERNIVWRSIIVLHSTSFEVWIGFKLQLLLPIAMQCIIGTFTGQSTA
nr:hypothetical transcript [Hymenolepis microstoma]